MKKWLEATPKEYTTYKMPDTLAGWLEARFAAHNLVLHKLSLKKLYEILPPELQDMITVTTEPNLGKFAGEHCVNWQIDEKVVASE